jgi:hypothetical protein
MLRSSLSLFPPEHTASDDETAAGAPAKAALAAALPSYAEGRDAPDPSSTTTVEPAAPLPRRTLFAVALQLARSFGPLCALLRAALEGNRREIVAQALMIADAILFGARDRNRDKFRRTLFDQQQRSDSLLQTRPARPRPKKPVAQRGQRAA